MCELLPSDQSDPVVLRFAIVFRGAPEGSDEPLILESMERRIEGTVLDLENLTRCFLNNRRDRMSMCRAKNKRSKNEHVEGALQHVTGLILTFSCHALKLPEEYLVEQIPDKTYKESPLS
jgi:hypothetical protein